MKIAVLGLWHLGCVTAACCAKHFEVVGLDFDAGNIARLQTGKAPLLEPGLDALLATGLASGRLRFTSDAASACAGVDLLWIAHDTPVDDDDRADVEHVLAEARRCIPLLPRDCLVLLSSQLPVGTCRQLETEFGDRGYRFAYSPENLRLGKAIDVFTHPGRVVVGCRDARARNQLAEVFAPFTSQIVWMRPESAEMTKHAINSFLALSIAFMNEIAVLCETTGADAKEVECGLKSESRIGPKAYLSPGGAFAGGTLARDIVAVTGLAQRNGEPVDVLPAVKRSNDRHRHWPLRKIRQLFPASAGVRIALLGLTYKPGTDTLRRSSAVELARALHAAGFDVRAFDPSQPALPADLAFVQLGADAATAVTGADAVVLCTEWPEFRALDWTQLINRLHRPILIDAGRFLEKSVAALPALRHISVGSPT